MTRRRFDLTDFEWTVIQPLLPNKPRGVPRVDDRRVVMHREAELDGDLYGLMTAVADALSAKYPLPATVVLRSMIDFTLRSGRSSRYKHAARHLAECRSLASQIKDFGSIQSNDAYVACLKREHGRKSGFWSLAQWSQPAIASVL